MLRYAPPRPVLLSAKLAIEVSPKAKAFAKSEYSVSRDNALRCTCFDQTGVYIGRRGRIKVIGLSVYVLCAKSFESWGRLGVRAKVVGQEDQAKELVYSP